MSEQSSEQVRPRSTAPWVVAGVLVLIAALLVVLVVRTRAVGEDNTRNAGRLMVPTESQQQAVAAGATEAANLTTLSRSKYDSDFARALAGATGNLAKDLRSHKSAYLSAMNAGKFDLKATVVQSAFESEADGKVLVLVTLNGTHVVDKVASPVATPQRLELTMIRSGSSWLASEFVAVGVQ
jgi:hypothetical protein